MPDRDDAQLDALLRGHLSAKLDGQAGRAEAAFLRHVRATAAPVIPAVLAEPPRGFRLSPAQPPASRRFLKFGPWMVAWAGTALAACLAVLWAGPALFPAQPAGSQGDPVTPSPQPKSSVVQQSGPMLHYVHDRTWDEGPVILDHDGTPVPGRRVHRYGWEQTQWYDPERKVRVERIVPREDVGLIERDTY